MQSSGRRKREVCSCLPCYTRKQKCNRQYPCDRCTRRRQPERCVYASSPPAPITKKRDEDMQISDNNWEQHNKDDENDNAQTFNSSPTVVTTGRTERSESSLAKAYGYYGPSEYTTMALVRKLVHEDDIPDAQDAPISNEIAAEVRKTLDKMLSRSILDFLVRYFVTKVNWIEQLLYAPWFLTQYQRWWSLDRLSSVADIEFPILFLRTCCYASQYLPSPSYTIDSIKGVALVDIRKSCEEVINALAPICVRLDPQGSLIRVLHILFAGLGSLCIGRMNAFWESLSCGTRVAQQIGLHRDTIKWSISTDELEKEMTRRAICNIYIWDSCLSKRLDRIPFLPDILSEDLMPRMRLLPDTEIGTDVPDVFTERVLRAKLAQFWRNHGATKDSEYDAIAAEERYEMFCADFLQTLPSAFALQPDKQWDTRLPTLPMQRQLLHNAIFEHLCWNFRPVLFQRLDQVQHLPGYKQILITHNKQALAVASLALLDGVSNLHTMMGGSHTRFSGVIVPTFEATVPLLCLYADKDFPEEIAPESPSHVIMKADPIGNGIRHVTRAKCMQAARGALACLQNLAEVSNLAETGARTLARLINSIESSPPYAETYGDSTTIAINLAMQTSEDWNYSQVQEYALGDSQAIFQYDNGQCREIGPSWEEMLQDLNGSFLPGEFGSF